MLSRDDVSTTNEMKKEKSVALVESEAFMNNRTKVSFDSATLRIIEESEELLKIAENNRKTHEPALEEYCQTFVEQADIVALLLQQLYQNKSSDSVKKLDIANNELNSAINNWVFLAWSLSDANNYIKRVYKATNQTLGKLDKIKAELDPDFKIEALSNRNTAESAFVKLIISTDELVQDINTIFAGPYSFNSPGETLPEKYKNIFRYKDFCYRAPTYTFEPQLINNSSFTFEPQLINNSSLSPTENKLLQANWTNSIYLWGVGGIIIGKYVIDPVARSLARTSVNAARSMTNLVYSGIGFFTKKKSASILDEDLESIPLTLCELNPN
jgi:hypothetical protein